MNIKRIYKKFFWGILIFFVILTGTVIIIAHFYEDSIKDLFIKEINKHLTTEISVKDINFSLLRKFPNASLEFTDIVARDSTFKDKKGILLKAKNVYLQFNVLDLINKNYTIKEIDINKGNINLLFYKDGIYNLHFWKSLPDSVKSLVSVDLQKITFSNINVFWKNYYDIEQEYSFVAKDIVLKGNFSDIKYSLRSKGEIFINYVKIENVTFLKNKDAEANLVLKVNTQNNIHKYKFEKCVFSIDNLNFDINGNVVYSDVSKYSDLKVKGKNLDAQSFIKEIPKEYNRYFKDYKSKGELYFNTMIKGRFDKDYLPLIVSNFGLKNAKIIKKNSSVALENVNLTGTYSNGNQQNLKSSYIDIKGFTANLKSGKIKADFVIQNFVKPQIELISYAELNLDDLNEFINLDTISSIKGYVNINSSFKCKPNSINKFTSHDFINSTTSGKMIIKDVDFCIKNNPLKYNNFNGEFVFNNNDIVIKNFTGKISESDFNIKGYLRNILSYIFISEQKLQIKTSMTSKNINLDELLHNKSSKSDTNGYKLTFSDKLDINSDINIDKINFKKFKATDIKGKVKLKDQKLFVNDITLNTMDGKISATGSIDATYNDSLLIISTGSIKKVDVNKMFEQFENFGQDNLKDKNLKGILCSDVQFVSVWSSDLKICMDKIYANADITIEKGELIDYISADKLSKFLKIKDLSDIKFSALQNHIEIKNKKIFIPEMQINSNAINITGSGTHTFDNKIDYHLKILLSELLAKKAKKAKKENEEFGIVEDDSLGRTSLYVHITGTVDRPVFKYDKKKVKKKIKNDIKKEKNNIKKILNEEFGLFKKDTTINKKQAKKIIKEQEILKQQEQGKFIIEWEKDTDEVKGK
jgi:hypothetical protein